MLCVPAALGLIIVGRWLLLAFGWRYYHYGFSSLVILALAAGPIAATYWFLTVLRLAGKLRAIVFVNGTYAVATCAFVWLGSAHGLTGVATAWSVGALIAACVAGVATPRERYARHRRPVGGAVATHSTYATPGDTTSRSHRKHKGATQKT